MTKMKISVDVETEAHLYDPREADSKQQVGKGGLKWRIDVSMAEAAPSLTTISEEATEAVTRLPASSVTRARVSRVSRVDLNSAAAETAIRKLSSTSELIERMGRGRKVITLKIIMNQFKYSISGVPPRRMAGVH